MVIAKLSTWIKSSDEQDCSDSFTKYQEVLRGVCMYFWGAINRKSMGPHQKNLLPDSASPNLI